MDFEYGVDVLGDDDYVVVVDCLFVWVWVFCMIDGEEIVNYELEVGMNMLSCDEVLLLMFFFDGEMVMMMVIDVVYGENCWWEEFLIGMWVVCVDVCLFVIFEKLG